MLYLIFTTLRMLLFLHLHQTVLIWVPQNVDVGMRTLEWFLWEVISRSTNKEMGRVKRMKMQ